MKSRLLWFVLLVFSLCSSAALFAQDTASITGTVSDPSGAAIPGAQVTLISAERGINRTSTTNGSGDYLFASLPIGSYDLTVSDAAFKKYDAKGIILRVAEKSRVDVAMQVGAASTEVIVQGQEVAQVETQSSDLGGTVTGKEITQLELNGRNFTQLITLVPGVSNQTGQDEAGVGVSGSVSFSVNGGRTEYNNWELDGGDAMDNGSNTTLNVYPSVDAIAEFKVLTSNYGAQYGRNGSGTVEVETKSGTNAFHGSVWEYLRNEAFNAHNYFDLPGTPVAGYHKHDFGYSVGGPIWKNHTFFFWLQNWRREVVPFNFFNYVPSMANRTGNFSDQCAPINSNPTDCPIDPSTGNPYPNNTIPSVDPNAQLLLPMIPEANTTNGGQPVFAAAVPEPTHWLENLVRIDHDFNPKLRSTFRFIHDSWDTTNATVTWGGESFPTIGTHFVGPGVEIVAKLTAT